MQSIHQSGMSVYTLYIDAHPCKLIIHILIYTNIIILIVSYINQMNYLTCFISIDNKYDNVDDITDVKQ